MVKKEYGYRPPVYGWVGCSGGSPFIGHKGLRHKSLPLSLNIKLTWIGRGTLRWWVPRWGLKRWLIFTEAFYLDGLDTTWPLLVRTYRWATPSPRNLWFRPNGGVDKGFHRSVRCIQCKGLLIWRVLGFLPFSGRLFLGFSFL